MLHLNKPTANGFTIIELSIVLVVIGLVIGGIVVGRDLMAAATIRSQISQIEKYRTAVNSFLSKYAYLPGDLPGTIAAQTGFIARAGTLGRGDGNGLIEAADYSNGNTYGWNLDAETLFFWADLSQAGLIEGSYNSATDARASITLGTLPKFIPAAKYPGVYVTVFTTCSFAGAVMGCFPIGLSSVNYFAVTAVKSLYIGSTTNPNSTDGGLSVSQAFAIDTKLDDGIPTTGKVQAFYLYGSGINPFGYAPNAPTPSATT